MTDDPSPGRNGAGEAGVGTAQRQPWFPPSAEPVGSVPPPPPGAGRSQAPKPGVIPLRPLGVGEILDGAFTAIRRNPKATLGLAAVLLTFSAVITTAVSLLLVHHLGSVTLPSQGQHFTNAGVFVPILVLTAVFAFIVDTVLTGLLTVVIGRSMLGHKITAAEAWRIARPRLPALIGATLLVLLTLVGIWVVFGSLVFFLGRAVVLLGVIAATVLTIWFGVMFRMVGPVVVLEREGPARSLARSWRLVRRSFWRVFGISLLAWLIVVVTALVLQIPFTVIAGAAGGGNSHLPGTTTGSLLGVVISAVGGIVAGAVARPISAGVTVLLYVDLRMRREGLDLVLQTAAASGTVPTGDEFASLWRPGARAPAAPGAPPPPQAGPFAPQAGPFAPQAGPFAPQAGARPLQADAIPPPNRLGRRVSAALVDIALLAVLFLILGQATGRTPTHTLPPGAVNIGVGAAEVGTWSLRYGEVTVAGWWLALYLALVLSYYFALEAATGRTVGKLLLGLRVTSRDGTRPSAAAIAARTLLRLVDWLPVLYLAGFISMLATRSRRQRLGDLAARTEVAVVAGATLRRWHAVVAGIVAGLVILGLSVRVTSGPPSGQAPAAATKPCHSVSFDHPAGWLEVPAQERVVSHPVCRTALFIGPSDAIVVEAYPAPGRVTAANLGVVTPLVTGEVRRVTARDGGALLAGPQRTTAGGLPALEYRASGRSYSGVAITSRLVIAFAGQTAYQIDCQQTRAHAAQVTRACGQVLRTFTVAGYPASPAPGTAPPAGSPQRWLQGLGWLRQQMNNALPAGVITAGSLRRTAAALRRCTPELAALGPPASPLRPTYRLARQACAALYQAAGYATAAARAYTTTSPSSRAGRKLSKLLNRLDAAVNHGTGLIDNAYYGAPVLPPGYPGS